MLQIEFFKHYYQNRQEVNLFQNGCSDDQHDHVDVGDMITLLIHPNGTSLDGKTKKNQSKNTDNLVLRTVVRDLKS